MYLEVIIEDESVKVYGLTQKEAVIGASTQNHIILSSPGISKNHARVFTHEGHWFIQDLGSTNGTFLENGDQLPSKDVALFKPDQTVRLAGHVYLRLLVVAPQGKILPLNLINVGLQKEKSARVDQDKTKVMSLKHMGLQQAKTKEQLQKENKRKEAREEWRLKIKLHHIVIGTLLASALSYRVSVYLKKRRLAEEVKKKETIIAKMKKAQIKQEKTIEEATEASSKSETESSLETPGTKDPEKVVE